MNGFLKIINLRGDKICILCTTTAKVQPYSNQYQQWVRNNLVSGRVWLIVVELGNYNETGVVISSICGVCEEGLISS